MKKLDIDKPIQLERKLNVAEGGAMFLTGFIFLYLFQLFYIMLIGATRPEFANTLTSNILVIILNQVVYTLAVFVYAKISKHNLFKGARIKKVPTPKQSFLLVAIALVSLVAFAPLASLLVEALYALGFKSSLIAINPETFGMLVLFIFIAGLLPAVVEEILFRGCVAKGFSKKGYVFAIICSSLLFALIHGSIEQFLHQFLLGMVMCFVYFATKSIWASAIIHFVNNFTSLVLSYVFYKTNMSMTMNSNNAVAVILISIAVSIVGILGLIALLRYYLRVCLERKAKEDGVEFEKSKTPTKDFFRAIGRAFTPDGVSQNTKSINKHLAYLYEEKEENDAEAQILENEQKEIDIIVDKALKETLEKERALKNKKMRKADIVALVISFSMVLIVWLFNLVGGFKG